MVNSQSSDYRHFEWWKVQCFVVVESGLHPLEEVGMSSALPSRTCHSVFCVGDRILGFGLFSIAPPLPKIHRLCILCLINYCRGTLWACMTQSRYIWWWWDCPEMSTVHRGKGNACYLLCSGWHGSNENRQQFPGMAHEEDLQGGLRSPLHQRKGDFLKEMHSKENQPAQVLWGCSWCTRYPWRLPAMASITSLLTSG